MPQDHNDNIQEMYRRARKAFEIVEYWPQEKIDEMCAAVGWEWQKDENAKPMGVVANVVPMTNPEGTVCTIGLSLLKTRNSMICSPHPRTKQCSYMAVEIARKGLKKVGAPEDLFQCIQYQSN